MGNGAAVPVHAETRYNRSIRGSALLPNTLTMARHKATSTCLKFMAEVMVRIGPIHGDMLMIRVYISGRCAEDRQAVL
jgi:hypothetical protein